MSTTAHPAPANEAALAAAELARALDAILASLLALLRTFARYTALLGPLAIPVWNRISRTRQRLARALAHLAAGHAPRPAPAHATPAKREPRPRDPNAHVPVRRHGWLGALLDHHVRAHASQLQHLLAQPGMADVIAASPAARRTLRPLCRMLGAEVPAALRLPPRPRPEPKPVQPKPEQPKPPGPGLLPGDRPFPPYILRLVRAHKRHGLWRPWKPE